MKLVSKLLTNLKMREMKLVSILISYIMLKNYQTRLLSQNKSLYLHELQNVNVSEIINFD